MENIIWSIKNTVRHDLNPVMEKKLNISVVELIAIGDSDSPNLTLIAMDKNHLAPFCTLFIRPFTKEKNDKIYLDIHACEYLQFSLEMPFPRKRYVIGPYERLRFIDKLGNPKIGRKRYNPVNRIIPIVVGMQRYLNKSKKANKEN